MKYLILVITFGILISGCSNNTNTSEKHNLKGKVKKLTEFTYYSETEFGDVVKGSVKEKKESNFSEEYNLDGKLKERITYTTSKNPDHKYYYFYSEDDQLIKIEHRDGLDDDLFTTSNYTYDGDLLIQIIEEYPKEEGGELKVKTTYEYNQKGKIIHIHSYNHYYEELVFDRTYNYNENSKLISIEIKGDE
ncbi:MAG: hypothetical protein HOG05_00770, partial [Bacteroidetes bacterium]|nr:hypothetical protein [Bacteroidota bacterium]